MVTNGTGGIAGGDGGIGGGFDGDSDGSPIGPFHPTEGQKRLLERSNSATSWL